MQKIFALVDCNAFFCSCEQLFRPDLRHKPVGVLSNNDGCFVSRTKELKALGVKMGEPYFKVKDICEKHGVHVFSSNFSLYTNMSDRVMLTLSEFTPELEVYSVDEAFLNLTGFETWGLEEYARKIKATVEKNTGIPVSIGLGPTKTLAKVANHIAKKSDKAKGVVCLLDPRLQDIALAKTEVEDLWGVGRANARKLRSLNIRNAKEFRDYKNDKLIKKIFTKVGLQIKEELQAYPRFELKLENSNKKQINCSRTFGTPVFELQALREAVANYVSSACEKLRKQKSVCFAVEVYMRTSPFKNVPQYYAIEEQKMLSGTSDTRKVIKYAMEVLDKLYRAGYEYKKAGVRLSHIIDRNQAQMSLFDLPDDVKSDSLMKCMDRVNARDGSGTLKVAACGVNNKAWAMNRNLKSPRYVTGWTELRKVY
ncbi:MAG: Y-family DNA polymerase [Bdellovibrionaceae bacterium]|nr:Y-family DNA polymerase [Pseudobdellovibrionaceae bacterium]